jgi:dephospho-CoA kinase
MTRVIGLTGGIGSGKSTVSRFLAELGARIVDADKIGHQSYQPGTDSWRDLVQTFGRDILAQNETIDRQKLAAIVFSQPEELKIFNAIVHPRMYKIAEKQIEEFRRQGVKVIVLDAPILFETNWTPLVDEVWVVVADEPHVIGRATARSGLNAEQIKSRIRAQMSNEDRIKRADAVIYNNGTAEELREKVNELWQRLKV